jgi:hypothetical protein
MKESPVLVAGCWEDVSSDLLEGARAGLYSKAKTHARTVWVGQQGGLETELTQVLVRSSDQTLKPGEVIIGDWQQKRRQSAWVRHEATKKADTDTDALLTDLDLTRANSIRSQTRQSSGI